MNEHTTSILNHSLEYAKDLLENTGEFYPFGAFVDTVGQVHPLEMEVDKKNIPNNGKVIETLSKFCKKELELGNFIAYGVTYEAAVQLSENEEKDTICVHIVNTQDENTPDFYQPFSSTEQGINYEPIFAVKKDHE